MAQTVNSIKLTKLEKKVIIALFNSPQWIEPYKETRPEGNNVYGIAKQVYGESVLNPYQDLSLKYSVRSSLNRILKHLWKRELVLKCRPNYYYSWEKVKDRNGTVIGWWGKTLRYLRSYKYDERGSNFVSVPRFARLPDRTHIWWLLTDKGRDLAEELTGITQRRERCRSCNCWSEQRQICQIERIGEGWKELDECEDENYWKWDDDLEGWWPAH